MTVSTTFGSTGAGAGVGAATGGVDWKRSSSATPCCGKITVTIAADTAAITMPVVRMRTNCRSAPLARRGGFSIGGGASGAAFSGTASAATSRITGSRGPPAAGSAAIATTGAGAGAAATTAGALAAR